MFECVTKLTYPVTVIFSTWRYASAVYVVVWCLLHHRKTEHTDDMSFLKGVAPNSISHASVLNFWVLVISLKWTKPGFELWEINWGSPAKPKGPPRPEQVKGYQPPPLLTARVQGVLIKLPQLSLYGRALGAERFSCILEAHDPLLALHFVLNWGSSCQRTQWCSTKDKLEVHNNN